MIKVIQNFKRNIKKLLLKRLAKALLPFLSETNHVRKKSLYPDYCTAIISPSATLSSESSIENFANSAKRIIVGDHSYVRGRLMTYGHGGSISIGQWCYIGLNTEIWSMDSITIGDRVLISHGVNIHDATAHSLDANERHRHFKHIIERGHPSNLPPGVNIAPIIIEDDVWINFGVSILKGVRIGKGSVIAAGSIVTKDVPPGMLYKCHITPQLIPLT